MSKSAAKKIQAIRGMNDLLPSDSPRWQFFEGKVRQLMHRYGFDEIRTPIVEQTALFARSIGEVTDIVEKEMYTFDDRNGDSLTLRPEGTSNFRLHLFHANIRAGTCPTRIVLGILTGKHTKLFSVFP